eukprot:SAG31_NODE_2980_length_4829_cov_3.156237_2_plen_150_part_00
MLLSRFFGTFPAESPIYVLLFMGLIEKYGTNRESVTLQGDGDLNQTEVIRLLKKIGFSDLSDEAMQELIYKFDEDNSGTINVDEFIAGVNALMSADEQQSEYLKEFWANNTIKVGFAGTTWRPMANVLWLMNMGVTIIALGVITGFVVR